MAEREDIKYKEAHTQKLAILASELEKLASEGIALKCDAKDLRNYCRVFDIRHGDPSLLR